MGQRKKPQLTFFCEYEALATRRHTSLGYFFLDPEDLRCLSTGAVWSFIEATGLPWLGNQFKVHKGPVKKAHVHRDRKGSNPLIIILYYVLFCSILFFSIIMAITASR